MSNSTTVTRDGIVFEAAQRLNIVGTGQSLDPEYGARIDAAFDPLINQLATDGICNVVDDMNIPNAWFDGLSGLLANQSASVAGASFDPTIKGYYEGMLKRVSSSRPTYVIQEAEYF
jgi:hypothetical protein